MSKIENLIQQIRTQIGSEFISTDIVGIDGLSIAGDATSQGFNLGSNATLLKSLLLYHRLFIVGLISALNLMQRSKYRKTNSKWSILFLIPPTVQHGLLLL
jgi:hypothetical protein